MERTTTPPSPPTEDELERFRQEWQKELQQQREQRQRHGDSATQRQADAYKAAVVAKAASSGSAARVEAGSGIETSSSASKSKQPDSSHKAYKSTFPKSTKTGSAIPGQATSRPEHELREGGSKSKAKAPTISSPLLSSTSAVSTSSTTALTSTSASKALHPKPLQSSNLNGKKVQSQSQSSAQNVKTTQAVEQYANAVELEQMGRLNEALQAYRGAYRLDAQVEKSYHAWVTAQESALLENLDALELTDPKQSIVGSLAGGYGGNDEVYTFRTEVQLDRDYVPRSSSVVQDGAATGSSGPGTEVETRAYGDGVTGLRDRNLDLGVGTSGSSTPREPGVGDRNDPLTRILFSWLETAREEILHPPVPTDPPVASSSSTQVVPTYKSPYSADRLPQTIHDLYHHLPLLPLDEKDPDSEILLSKLPEEILENVVEFMDVATLERFGSVCKRLRVLTRGVGKWRTLCRQIYRPPILPPEISLSTLVKRHGMDYRTTFLEERRVRYDGVYISVCHYIRPGQSELAWVNITHLITYHRFLRFYPDGTVIALLTTDHPVDVVHNIKPSLRAKGTLMGRWSLSDWDPEMEKDRPPFPVNELDPAWPPDSRAASKSRPSASHHAHAQPHAHAAHPINLISITDLIEPGVAHPKYSFEMNLDLRSAQRGRWNKLVMRDYQSVRLGTGEALGLSLKHQKPFFFSKVRSYSNTL